MRLKPRAVLEQVLRSDLEPTLTDLGLRSARRLRWRNGLIKVRTVIDKIDDPYIGGAFQLEFEHSPHGIFEKLAGRVRVEQLLDDSQRDDFLALRNAIASSFQEPTADYLQMLPTFLHDQYLSHFQRRDDLEQLFWMRFSSERDAAAWARLIRPILPVLLARTATLDPDALMLGKPLSW